MKTYQIVICALLMYAGAGSSWACSAADQYRLFPLGSSSSGFVFVETHLHRTDDPNGSRYEMASKWFGEGFLNVYDATHRLISSRLIDSLSLSDKETDPEFIKSSFAKGLVLAKQLPGFMAAKPLYLSFCDFQQACKEAELRVDTLKHALFVKLRNQKEYEVNVLKDTASVAGSFLRYYSNFNGGVIDYRDIDISSVRRYSIGARTVTLVHLANGDKPKYTDKEGGSNRKEHRPEVAFGKLEDSVVYEPLLHHGHGFDFFMVEYEKLSGILCKFISKKNMEEPKYTPYNSTAATTAPQDLPNSNTILVLGILSIVFAGLIGIILAIIALSMWGNLRTLYQDYPQDYTAASYSRANAGRICAIVGLCLVGLILLIVLAVVAAVS